MCLDARLPFHTDFSIDVCRIKRGCLIRDVVQQVLGRIGVAINLYQYPVIELCLHRTGDVAIETRRVDDVFGFIQVVLLAPVFRIRKGFEPLGACRED